MSILIKVILVALLFICLADMPYGYFQFVRFAAMVGFGILAYLATEDNKKTEVIIYVVLAVLFQPFMKISLGRELWNVVGVIVGIGLLVSIFFKKRVTTE